MEDVLAGENRDKIVIYLSEPPNEVVKQLIMSAYFWYVSGHRFLWLGDQWNHLEKVAEHI